MCCYCCHQGLDQERLATSAAEDAATANAAATCQDKGNLIPQFDGCNDESLNKQSSLYPTLLCTNARSIMPKMECICSTIEQEKADISFVSEMWLQNKKTLHVRELERRLNLDGSVDW